MNRSKKLVLSAAVVLGAATVVGAGTFASFNAQTKNPDNVLAAGTLVLSNTKDGGAACLSTAGGTTDTNANAGCDTLLSLTVQKPGDSGTADLTIANAGSLAASELRVFSAACTDGDASGESYHGTGLPCDKVQLYVQQYADPAFATPSACLYGGATVATICDFSDATKTLSDFQTAYGTSGSGLLVGSLAAGASNYFKVGVMLPSSADNTFQGRQATFDLTWHAVQ